MGRAASPQLEGLLWSISQVCTLVQQQSIPSIAAATDLLARLRRLRSHRDFEKVDEARQNLVNECEQALNGWVNRKEHFLEWKKHLLEMKTDMLLLDDRPELQERAWALLQYLSQEPKILATLPSENRNTICQVLLSFDTNQHRKKLTYTVKRRVLLVLQKAVSLGTGNREDDLHFSILTASQTKQIKLLMERFHRAPMEDQEHYEDYSGGVEWYGDSDKNVPPTPDTPFYGDYSYQVPMPAVPSMPLDAYMAMANGDFYAMQGMYPMEVPMDMTMPMDAERMLTVAELEAAELEEPAEEEGARRVASLLESLGLDKYVGALEEAEVTWDAFLCMKESDLADLGMPKGPRIKLRQALRDLQAHKEKLSLQSPAEPPLPVGLFGSTPCSERERKMMLHISPPGSTPSSGKDISPSMPSLDSLKSIWKHGDGQPSLSIVPKGPYEGSDEADDERMLKQIASTVPAGGDAGLNANAREFVPRTFNPGTSSPLSADAREFFPSRTPSSRSRSPPISTPTGWASPLGMKQLNPRLEASSSPSSVRTPERSVPRTPPPAGAPPQPDDPTHPPP